MNGHYLFRTCSAMANFALKLQFFARCNAVGRWVERSENPSLVAAKMMGFREDAQPILRGSVFYEIRSDSGIGGGGVVEPAARDRCTITVSAQRPER